MRKLLTLLLAVALWAPRPSLAADAVPFLVVETGVHEAPVNAMAALADGGIITVSNDKTARIWRSGGVEAAGVIRPPIGPGDDGALYAVAASAKTIAVAGRIKAAQGGFAVAFYSADAAQDFRPLAILPGLPSAVLALRMSPAGDRLAVGLEAGGLRVYDLKTLQLAMEDLDLPGKITALDFDATGRLAVAGDDNVIRLYDGALRRLPPMTLRAGARAYGLAFSPDGTKLVAGDRDRPSVYLFDMRTMRLERTLEGAAGMQGGFTVVAFSPDGGTVFGGGTYNDKSYAMNIRRWPLSGGAAVDVPAAKDLVTGLLPEGRRLLFATAEPVLGVMDEANRVQAVRTPRHIDFHDRKGTAVRLSRSGDRIEITRAGGRALIFDVGTREFLRDGGMGQAFAPPVTSGHGIAITDWRDSRAPKISGQAVRLEPGETARSAAVSPEGAVLGTDFYVRFFGRNGTGWKVPASAPVWAVHASTDGRLVVACFGDGTIHWYNAATGRELAAVFIDPATEQFVQWTPAGYFDHDHPVNARSDGRSLIGYRINQAAGRASDFISIDQLYSTWFRPDLVGLSFRDDDTARLRVKNQEVQAGTVGEVFRRGLPPKVTLLEACVVDSMTVSVCNATRSIDIRTRGIGAATAAPVFTAPVLLARYTVEEQGADPGQVLLRLNEAVLDVKKTLQVESTDGRKRVERVMLPLAHGQNVVRLSPATATGAIESGRDVNLEIRLVRAALPREPGASQNAASPTDRNPTSSQPAAPETTARLFALTIGVGKVPAPLETLDNAANDAVGLAALLRQDQGRLFASVEVTDLTDEKASKASIIAALRGIAAKATPDDVVVIFFAGHGKTVNGKYYFVPYDMGRGDPSLLAKLAAAKGPALEQAVDALFQAEGLGQDQLLPLIQAIQATRIAFILDTCESATVADANMVLRHDLNTTIAHKIGQASGRFVLSGSFTEALDSGGDPGHGLFTSFLLRALKGEAGTDEAGRIDISQLAKFTKEKVMAKSREINPRLEQRPAWFFAGSDFFAVRKLLTAVKR